jgi:hypothetical protein
MLGRFKDNQNEFQVPREVDVREKALLIGATILLVRTFITSFKNMAGIRPVIKRSL